MNGRLFLIPSYLSDSNEETFIAPMVKDLIANTNYFLVENVRTARRFISSLKLGLDISQLQFEVMDKSTNSSSINDLLNPIKHGYDVGIISEAGLPGLADPGNVAICWAHQNDVQISALPGSSSIQMALIASGFNGQQFTFHGYLPIDKKDRNQMIKGLELELNKSGYTQLFMETPFRNDQLLLAILNTCHPNTLLSIASDISGNREFIKTREIRQWKKDIPSLHKIPTIFSLGTYPV